MYGGIVGRLIEITNTYKLQLETTFPLEVNCLELCLKNRVFKLKKNIFF
jgi:hypothetical protein